jgi:hypothetical protein
MWLYQEFSPVELEPSAAAANIFRPTPTEKQWRTVNVTTRTASNNFATRRIVPEFHNIQNARYNIEISEGEVFT